MPPMNSLTLQEGKTNIYWKEKPPVEEKGLILSPGSDRPARQTPGICMHCWTCTQENCRNHVLSGVSGNSFLQPRFYISLLDSIPIYPPASSCLGVLEIPENQDRESGRTPQNSAWSFSPAPPNAPFYKWLNPHPSTGQNIIGYRSLNRLRYYSKVRSKQFYLHGNLSYGSMLILLENPGCCLGVSKTVFSSVSQSTIRHFISTVHWLSTKPLKLVCLGLSPLNNLTSLFLSFITCKWRENHVYHIESLWRLNEIVVPVA